jgi:glucokinase
MDKWVIGIDLGASKVAMGLISPDDRIVVQKRFATDVPAGPLPTLERMAHAVREFAGQAPAPIHAIGICAPGPVDHINGIILDPPNLRWHNTPFRDMLAQLTGLPVILEHDAKATGIGEFYFGMGRQLQARDLVYVIVGTGIGCAILIDGQVYRGRANSAGEIGHITIDRHGPISTGGVAGGVEVYAGGPAIEQHYARLSGTHLSGAEIAQRARVGDAHALSAFNDAGDALGAAIASVAMMMDVDLFVIGGSVSKAGDLVLEPARKAVLKYSFASVGPRIRIYATELYEDGAILGAGWLASKL